jgi:hypothetical protein
VQTLFGGSPPPAVALKNPQAILENTLLFSKEFMRRYFLAWYWAFYLLLKFFGFGFFLSIFAAMVCLAIGCFTFGLVRAIDESRKGTRPTLTAGWQHGSVAAPPPPPQSHLPASWNAQPGLPPKAAADASDPFVGNLVLGIFHLETCHWVDTISLKNRVGFSTAAEAKAHGFKPCRICSPPW